MCLVHTNVIFIFFVEGFLLWYGRAMDRLRAVGSFALNESGDAANHAQSMAAASLLCLDARNEHLAPT